MPFGSQELTDTGVSYLAQAQLGDELRITRMVVGSGIAANIPDDLWPLTDLIAFERDVAITSSMYVTPDTIKVVGTLSSGDVPTGAGFEFNEVGLFAECGTLPAALYSVDNTGGGGDYIPDMDSTAPVVQQIEIYIKIARVDNISIVVQPAGTYDAVNRGLATVGPGPYIEKVGDVLHFKRFVAGQGIEIFDDALTPPETITIAVKVLKIDLDLYVTENHPDKPVDGLGFPTIQDALNYLSNIAIPPERTATIHVQRGVFDLTAPIVVDHPQSNRIRMIGEVETTRTIISVGATTGVPGDYAIPITLDSAANIVAGDLVAIDTITGGWSLSQLLRGLFTVTNVTGNVMTIQVTYTSAFTVTGVTGGTVIPFKTLIMANAAGVAVQIRGSGLLLLQNFAFIGNYANTGVLCEINTVTTLQTIGCLFFNLGFNVVSSHATGTNLYAARCAVGFYSTHANLNLSLSLAFSYNERGIELNSSNLAIRGSTSVCANNYAINLGSSIVMFEGGDISVLYNNNDGLYASVNTMFSITGAGTMLDMRVGNVHSITLYYLSALIKAGQSLIYYDPALSNVGPNFTPDTGCFLSPPS